jgi:phosphatidylcholine synthase
VKALASWGVHLYTASSAVFGTWALFAVFQHEFRLACYLMMLTLVIDSTDGALARWADVRRNVPWFDGALLDNICDYFTYVIVPACFMVEAGFLPHPLWAAVPVLASSYGFSRDDAKTTDHFFTGWPSYWNVAAMYFFLLDVRPETAIWITCVLAAAVFVPLRYIYPSRTRELRPLSLGVLGVWVLGFSWIAVRPDPHPTWVWVSLLGPAYYVVLSLMLHLRHGRAESVG